jgi:hypothetical protein
MLQLVPDRKPTFWPGGLNITTPAPIKLDASIREEHGIDFTITSSPVEDGSVITDHIIEQPSSLTMDVVATRTPDTLLLNLDRNRHFKIYRQLCALARRRQPFDVATTLNSYTGMVFSHIGTPRTDARGYLVITCILQKIEIATIDAQQAMAEAAQDMAQGEQDLGAVSASVDTPLAA